MTLRRYPLGCAAIACIVLAYPAVSLTQGYFQRPYQFVPSGLEVEKIIYQVEESWGFGPGGNETGILIYKLAPNVAKNMGDRKAVEKLGRTVRAGTRGQYDNWYPTPAKMPLGQSCEIYSANERCVGQASAQKYLSQYGFEIPVAKPYAALVDKALISAGSYYAYGRTGVFIIMPQKSRAAYLYAG